MQAKKQVRTEHGTTDWFQIAKGVGQGYILSPCLFNVYAEYTMRNTVLDEAQAGIKTAGRCVGEGNGNPFQYSCLENPRDRGTCWAASMGSHRVGHDCCDLAAAAAREISITSDTQMTPPLWQKVKKN